jgi:hypothetical protein
VAEVLETGKGPELSLRKMIENTVKSRHPGTVKQLATTLMADGTIDEADFVATVKEMASNGTLVLQPPSYDVESVLDYLFTPTLAGWLWASLAIIALAVLAVTLIPDLFPVSVVRWVLGSVFVLYLPGFSLIQLLFPKGKDIDSLERFALSIGLSLAVVPLIGLVLNFTPWGIRFAPITTSLGAFTTVALIAAAMRKYLEIRK